MKKFYYEFTEEEQKAIDKLSELFWYAEMSDSYTIECREKAELLKDFNQKHGYNFKEFHDSDKNKKCYFE